MDATAQIGAYATLEALASPFPSSSYYVQDRWGWWADSSGLLRQRREVVLVPLAGSGGVVQSCTAGTVTAVGGAGDLLAVAASQLGNVGGEIYWRWCGYPVRVPWCANECGYIDAGIVPWFTSCTVGVEWFTSRGLWQDPGTVPEPGQLIFFDWERDGEIDHVGIVERVEGDHVWTIEGNSSDRCRQRSYLIGADSIYGYGTPIYPTGGIWDGDIEERRGDSRR